MRKPILFWILLALLFMALSSSAPKGNERKTSVGIRDAKFFINDRPTYEGRVWNGNRVEGLLMNSRIVQGIFDDENPETAAKWKYPDMGEWDPDRNMDEFVEAMEE
jgi:hypothetical protein